jgi:Uma2 family endonuclease
MAIALPSPPGTDEKRIAAPVEPLENGDLLTAGAFLRRYEAMPHLKKAELIEGVVYMGSPVRLIHAEPDTLLQTWLGVYSAHTPGTAAASNATVRLDADNVAQPDALLRLLPPCGGRCQVDSEGYLNGPPELVVEIAASSASIDLRDKLRVYRRSGVREYLVWRTVENKFDWFVLDGDQYQPNTPDVVGRLQSQVFPGLCLDVATLLARHSAQVLQDLQAAVQSPAHAAFVARIAELGKTPP